MEREADVVIIGGGISGCAIAYNLAKRGSKVVLVEKGELASEGTGRSSANVRQQGRQIPEIPLMVECMKLWQALDDELGCETDFVRGGNIFIAETEEELAYLENSVREARGEGLECSLITPEETRRLVPPSSRRFWEQCTAQGMVTQTRSRLRWDSPTLPKNTERRYTPTALLRA